MLLAGFGPTGPRLVNRKPASAAMEAIHLAAAQEAVMEKELAELAHEIESGIETSFLSAENAHNNAIKLIVAIAIISVIVSVVIGVYLIVVNFQRSTENG